MKRTRFLQLAILTLLASTLILNVTAYEDIDFRWEYFDVTEHQAWFSSSFGVDAGKTIHVEWAADREVTVAILNEVDYQEDHSWTIMYRQDGGVGQTGVFEFPVQYSDKFYLAIQPPNTIGARIYSVSVVTKTTVTQTPPNPSQTLVIDPLLFGGIIVAICVVLAIVALVIAFVIHKKR